MEKFKYLAVTFLSDGRQDNELDMHIGKASAVMCQLYQLVVLKQELCTEAKLFVFRSVFVMLTYGHECWVMTERVRSHVQAAEMGFLQKVRDLSVLDKVKALTFVNLSTSNCYFSAKNNCNCAGMVM